MKLIKLVSLFIFACFLFGCSTSNEQARARPVFGGVLAPLVNDPVDVQRIRGARGNVDSGSLNDAILWSAQDEKEEQDEQTGKIYLNLLSLRF